MQLKSNLHGGKAWGRERKDNSAKVKNNEAICVTPPSLQRNLNNSAPCDRISSLLMGGLDWTASEFRTRSKSLKKITLKVQEETAMWDPAG